MALMDACEAIQKLEKALAGICADEDDQRKPQPGAGVLFDVGALLDRPTGHQARPAVP